MQPRRRGCELADEGEDAGGDSLSETRLAHQHAGLALLHQACPDSQAWEPSEIGPGSTGAAREGRQEGEDGELEEMGHLAQAGAPETWALVLCVLFACACLCLHVRLAASSCQDLAGHAQAARRTT